MAKCEICAKGVLFGNNVSHSNRKTNRIWNSNVKSVRVKVNGGTQKMYVCTSCLKSGLVERA
ncbi:MAG: 50S ribosomal protein L28 [Lachnospiraceae bacterium]|nr:50S ribosomal protein L28 [Lachnospiraceae bacterium]